MAVSGATLLISSDYAEGKLTTKERNKIRKPVVEKMRRDRINSSISQLRNLLEQEFQLLQPDSKPEKADILELAVKFLKQQTCSYPKYNFYQRKDHQDFSQGYYKCLNETITFLSVHCIEEKMQLKFLSHFNCLKSHPRSTLLESQPRSNSVSSAHHKSMRNGSVTNTMSLWRPW